MCAKYVQYLFKYEMYRPVDSRPGNIIISLVQSALGMVLWSADVLPWYCYYLSLLVVPWLLCWTAIRYFTVLSLDFGHFLLTGLDFLFQRCTHAPVQVVSPPDAK